MMHTFHNYFSNKVVDEDSYQKKTFLIYSSKYSFSFQIIFTLAVFIFLSTGATLAICLSFTYSLGSTSYRLAYSSIKDDTQLNVFNSALVVSQAVEGEIHVVASSICLRSATYARALIANGTRTHNGKLVPVLKPGLTFREYNFFPGCTYPLCPLDYGPLRNKSRVSYTGSLQSSSLHVWVRNGSHSTSLNTDQLFNAAAAKYPDGFALVDILQPQDIDMNSMHTFGPNSTEMFYLTALYPTSGGSLKNLSRASYLTFHRTYPGLQKNSTSYDPAARPWFQDAPVGNFHIYGPYQETFTQLLSVTIASRTITPMPSSKSLPPTPVTTVSAAVILLSSLADIINQVDYASGGKGILLNYDTLEVVVNGNMQASQLYASSRFKTVSEIDPNLAKFNLRVANNFEYTDPAGVSWIVATVPFLEHVAYSTGIRKFAFIMIVLARSDQALGSIPVLTNLINSTTYTILGVTIAICIGTAGSLLTLVYFVVRWLTRPLEKIRAISRQIVEISAEEETTRSYLKVIEDGKASTTVVRWDEIGSLTLYFWEMVNKLHSTNLKRKRRPKYPKNPFYVPGSNLSSKWTNFERLFHVDEIIMPPAIGEEDDVGVSTQKTGSSPTTGGDKKGGAAVDEDAATADDVPMSGNQLTRSSFSSTIYVTPIRSCIPSSLRIYWYFASFLLLLGLTLVMLATVYQLNDAGNKWMQNTGSSLVSQQVVSLGVVANAKARFASSFFVEIQMNLLSAARYQTTVLDGNLTNSNLTAQYYLPSYSLDPTDYYASPSPNSDLYSGYFVNASAKCQTKTACSKYEFTQEIKLTSLFDLQFQSYFHNFTNLDFLQGGFDKSGVTRNIPYTYKSYGAEAQCYIEDRTLALCNSSYIHSRCAQPSASNLQYPPYDPRCRSWYRLAVLGGDPSKMYVQYPRVASTGRVDITAAAPMKGANYAEGQLYGVLNVNVLISSLSDAINSIMILTNGYCYLIDSTNPDQLIIHPKLNLYVVGAAVVSSVRVVEGFGASEFQSFSREVLSQLRNSTSVTAEYVKGGQNWYLSSSSFVVGTAAYTLIATVPRSDVLRASDLVQKEISKNIENILLIFIYVLIAFILLVIIVSFTVVRAIVRPLNELRQICQKVAAGNYDVEVPKSPSSQDMEILLDAFSNMLVAIRFGGENFGRGHLDIAQKVFKESLRLYTLLGNKRGIGVSQNNLGAVSLSRGDFMAAEIFFKGAVANARALVETVTSWEGAGRAQRILSDRLGNLAVAYMEQGRLDEAADLLYESMGEDKRQNYIRGYIVKQGTLGLLLLKRKAFEAASRVITDALEFASSKNAGLLDEQWTVEEAAVTEQIALCNIGSLYETQGRHREAEEAYIDSLSYHEIMHVSTTNRALMALRKLFNQKNRRRDVQDLDHIAAAHNFKIKPSLSHTLKRIVFALEFNAPTDKYMIQNLLDGVRQLQSQCTTGQDMVAIVHSTASGVVKDFPLSKKLGRERNFEAKLSSFMKYNQTGGSPVDALLQAVDMLDDESLSTVDWIVLSTDADKLVKTDESYKRLRARLSHLVVGLVVVGLGEAPSEELRALAALSQNGVYLHSKPDGQSIQEAYTTATKFIQGDGSESKGQLVLEEI